MSLRFRNNGFLFLRFVMDHFGGKVRRLDWNVQNLEFRQHFCMKQFNYVLFVMIHRKYNNKIKLFSMNIFRMEVKHTDVFNI